VVTSPGHQQGRTTVARLLAASRRRSGATVLRVDGHHQHAEAQRARKVPLNGHATPLPTLEEFAEAGLDWVKDLWVDDDGVWVLPAADGAMAAAIAEGYAAEVLDEARAVFECVVVDAPPVLDGDGSPLSRKLLPLADAVLLVLPADSAVGTLYRSIEAFRGVPAPFVGVVLNRVPRPDRRRRPPARPPAQGATAAGGRR
jgi:Mrp family chromosome partitioning ATPase